MLSYKKTVPARAMRTCPEFAWCSLFYKKILPRLLVLIRLLSTFVFDCPDVSFFQYVTGLFSAMSFARTIKSEFKILNMKIMDMKKFITWWTGVNLDGVRCFRHSCRKPCEEHDRVLLQVRFLPGPQIVKIGT